jgi:hypothetical protein
MASNFQPGGRFWTAVADKLWLAFLVSGLGLLLIGSVGKVPWFNLDVVNIYFQIILVAAGVMLLLGGIYFGKYQPPKPEPARPTRQGKTAIDAALYEITIKSPKWGQELSPPVSISGTMKKKLPDGYELWLINTGTQNGQPAYWPQDFAVINNNGGWTLKYRPREFHLGEERRMNLYIVGKDGQRLFAYYR